LVWTDKFLIARIFSHHMYCMYCMYWLNITLLIKASVGLCKSE